MKRRATKQQSPERRIKRSTHRFRALDLYFESLVARGGPAAITLSDHAGVMAGGSRVLCDFDALDEAGKARLDHPDRKTMGAQITTMRLRVEGRTLRLSALGGLPPSARVLRRDIARILAERSASA